MVSINNGSNTSFHWLKFNELDIESIFLDKYRSANIEWSISLNEIQENTFATTDAHTDNQTNTIRTQYTPNTVAAIHNHPGGYPPSYTDVFALVNIHEKHRKFQYQFVAPKNSNFIYCLYLTDFEKAKQLRNKYKENPTLFQEEEKKLLRWLISNGGGAFPESEFAAYALAGVLQQEDSGIVLLQLNGTSGEFKQLHATVKTNKRDALVVEEIWLIILPESPTVTEPEFVLSLVIIGELTIIFGIFCELSVLRSVLYTRLPSAFLNSINTMSLCV